MENLRWDVQAKVCRRRVGINKEKLNIGSLRKILKNAFFCLTGSMLIALDFHGFEGRSERGAKR